MASQITVTGHYCPTDCNPEKDARPNITKETISSLKKAKALLLWFPGGKIENLHS